ncbi:MAG: hypothetical protein R3D57_12875 [Hyphomicrobiaceae bacterium]
MKYPRGRVRHHCHRYGVAVATSAGSIGPRAFASTFDFSQRQSINTLRAAGGKIINLIDISGQCGGQVTIAPVVYKAALIIVTPSATTRLIALRVNVNANALTGVRLG